jgi:predicted anti-sigma-YlaC factor YlaD
MNCRTIHDQLPDLVLENLPVPPEVEAHLGECRDCAGTLQALRSTMKLLDEWEAPEPSPYWDVRMQARLREEQQRDTSIGWLQHFRRPIISVIAALCLALGIGLYQAGRFLHPRDTTRQVAANHENATVAPTGTAVSDLTYLDRNSDMLQNFDALDYLDGDADLNTTN